MHTSSKYCYASLHFINNLYVLAISIHHAHCTRLYYRGFGQWPISPRPRPIASPNEKDESDKTLHYYTNVQFQKHAQPAFRLTESSTVSMARRKISIQSLFKFRFFGHFEPIGFPKIFLVNFRGLDLGNLFKDPVCGVCICITFKLV